MKNFRPLLLAFSMALASCFVSASANPLIVGSYDLPRMKSIKPLTFPRLHLYNASGVLIDRADWPKELASLKAVAGEAFCCVSDEPSPAGRNGPPRNCKKITYGANVAEHFIDLYNNEKVSISYNSLPKHRYLLVEYFASWCAPCIPARKEMEKFLSSSEGNNYIAVVVDFTKLVSEK